MPFQYLSGIVITGSLSTQPLFGSLGLPLSLAVQWQSDSREKKERERERGERRVYYGSVYKDFCFVCWVPFVFVIHQAAGFSDGEGLKRTYYWGVGGGGG